VTIVHISTNISTGCEHCSFRIDGEQFAESVNHYIASHGYVLMHVGQETTEGSSGLWHSTVAVLSKD
jgi:hypothetical protein